jgi:hypothetical protein
VSSRSAFHARLTIAALIATASIPRGTVAQEADARAALETVLAGIAEHRGRAVARLFSDEVLVAVDESRQVALFGDAEAVRGSRWPSMVLAARAYLTPAELDGTPPEVLGSCLDKGFLLRDVWAAQIAIGEVRVLGDMVDVTLILAGQRMPSPLVRLHAKDGWRVGLNALPLLWFFGTAAGDWAASRNPEEQDLLDEARRRGVQRNGWINELMTRAMSGPAENPMRPLDFEQFYGRQFFDAFLDVPYDTRYWEPLRMRASSKKPPINGAQ